MSATASYADILEMLRKCASMATVRIATHSRVVTYNGRVYRKFPKHDNIELGHIRKMIRYLAIDKDCAATYIQNL